VTAAGLAAVTLPQADGTAWASGLDVSGWDRRSGLTARDATALAGIGPAGLRRSRARGTRRSRSWEALARLTGPVDQAAAVLHHDRSDVHRRAAAHAAGIILQHCADTGQAYWAWTGWDWARLAGSGSKGFLDAQTLPTEKAVRPFLVALAYLLAGFSDFQHLGMFNRLHLAQLVFGGAAMGEVTAVFNRWGYRGQVRDGEYRLPGVLGQVLLVNRSPRLQDLTTAAFARLHAHPATSGHHQVLYALHRAAADLGHCDAPVRSGYNHAPVIEGADPAWTGWVERWHATSPLTPKVRAIIRTLMAKAGRWLAAEHPEITEPGQWTRQTTLFELQAWLGHRTPTTTQHYAKITPNTLSKAYTEAGYFARNVRTIEVLLDRDTVTSGAAAAGEPWQHYDLGHGYCTYTFFEQCPHRMACARCDFHTPKNSTKAQLLEAKSNLQQMLASIPLTDDERAAIDDGQAALDSLLGRLADIPTPSGATPRQIGARQGQHSCQSSRPSKANSIKPGQSDSAESSS
jgi:hypothetical protein